MFKTAITCAGFMSAPALELHPHPQFIATNLLHPGVPSSHLLYFFLSAVQSSGSSLLSSRFFLQMGPQCTPLTQRDLLPAAPLGCSQSLPLAHLSRATLSQGQKSSLLVLSPQQFIAGPRGDLGGPSWPPLLSHRCLGTLLVLSSRDTSLSPRAKLVSQLFSACFPRSL